MAKYMACRQKVVGVWTIAVGAVLSSRILSLKFICQKVFKKVQNLILFKSKKEQDYQKQVVSILIWVFKQQ